jgi:hypothetical protein
MLYNQRDQKGLLPAASKENSNVISDSASLPNKKQGALTSILTWQKLIITCSGEHIAEQIHVEDYTSWYIKCSKMVGGEFSIIMNKVYF